MIQCHGVESPERVEAIRLEYGLPVMKAISIETAQDFDLVRAYLDVADRILFDTKPPKGAALPGGNAVAFDWTLLSGRKFPLPWMLAGGLDAAMWPMPSAFPAPKRSMYRLAWKPNRGKKDPAKIHAFIKAAKGG